MEDHELKTWPELFKQVVTGQKTFEYRINDRNFKVCDTLCLREYCYHKNEYTGMKARVVVQKIWTSHDIPGIAHKYCIMSIRLLQVKG